VLPVAATRAARAILGDDTVPLYDAGLPRGGRRRGRLPHGDSPMPAAVHFSACVGAMFGPDGGGQGAGLAFRTLAERAGIGLRSPENVDGACCGTPWKSKGHTAGYAAISERTLSMLFASSDGGKLPIVCDASSCTEGLIVMRDQAVAHGAAHYAALTIIDAVEFVAEHILDRLTIEQRVGRLALHPTCSSRALGLDAALARVAAAVSDEVITPLDWNCCAFAGDRGMLHPELTASATEGEAAEVRLADCDAHASLNRTCEVAMTRATGAVYEHVLEILERASRGPAVE
jgi:D-lactate dehydrogenase